MCVISPGHLTVLTHRHTPGCAAVCCCAAPAVATILVQYTGTEPPPPPGTGRELCLLYIIDIYSYTIFFTYFADVVIFVLFIHKDFYT